MTCSFRTTKKAPRADRALRRHCLGDDHPRPPRTDDSALLREECQVRTRTRGLRGFPAAFTLPEPAPTRHNPPMPARAPSLVRRFDSRDNALNALRLLFASVVLVDHAWILGGFSTHDPSIGGLALGGWGVGAVFALSGFLLPPRRGASARPG